MTHLSCNITEDQMEPRLKLSFGNDTVGMVGTIKLSVSSLQHRGDFSGTEEDTHRKC